VQFVLIRLLVSVVLFAQAIAVNSARVSDDYGAELGCSRAAAVETTAKNGAPADSGRSPHHRHERCLQCPEIVASLPPSAILSLVAPSCQPSQSVANRDARALPLGRLYCDPNVFARAGPSAS
jgi:hypothetical protein